MNAAHAPAGPTGATPRSAFGRWLTDLSAPVDFAGDTVTVLSDPDSLVLVAAGAMDLFAARLVGARPAGRWTPLCRLAAGAVVCLGAAGPDGHAVIGRPVPGSTIASLPVATLDRLGRGFRGAAAQPDPVQQMQAGAELVAGIDEALTVLDHAVRAGLPPREFVPLEESERTQVRAEQVLRSVAGVLWVEVLSGRVVPGDVTGGDHDGAHPDTPTGQRPWLCLTEADWLTAERDSSVRARSTGAMLAGGVLAAGIVACARRFADAVDHEVDRRRDHEQRALDRQAEQNASADARAERSFRQLLADSVRRGRPGIGGATAPQRCLAMVAARAQVPLPAAISRAEPIDGDDRGTVERLAGASGVGIRRVRLVGRWWRRDCGPLVGYLRQHGRCVALLPDDGGYLMREPDGGAPVRVDAQVAIRLQVEATMLYRPLPARATRPFALLRFGISDARRELTRFALVAVAVAGIGLLVPVLTGAVLGSWVPTGQRDLVIQGSLLVMLSAALVALLTVVQNTAVLRLEGRVDLTVQAALWHRLLSLPVTFFSRYAAAELGTVAMGITAVRETLSSVSTVAALGLVVAALNLLLLFCYSLPLALIAVAMVAVSLTVSLLLARRGVRFQRELYRSEQRLTSRSYQMLSGLSTLRLAAAEGRAFAQWSKAMAGNVSCSLHVRRAQAAVTVFNSGFTLLCSVAIFALVGGPLRGSVGIAAFLAFFTAFNQVLAALMQFCHAAVAALAVVPMVEGLAPILSSPAETRSGATTPGELDGSIEVRGVSFRYGSDGPLVLDNVSFDVRPGEFVALVGATGSGKSTILRLLLGFEQPTGGSILFDGQDMRHLDITAVRRQCGVVLQNGALLAGDIASNILAGTGYGVDDAWRAAEMAGIGDDIRAMPMGMHTVIAEGGSTLSGGQRQRLMVARALLTSPRMLFFDEATSALDNRTQRVVTESTRRLHASRLVIAHRLSTIEHADRIVVLRSGRVVQAGSYQELLAEPGGAFCELVARQLIEPVAA